MADTKAPSTEWTSRRVRRCPCHARIGLWLIDNGVRASLDHGSTSPDHRATDHDRATG